MHIYGGHYVLILICLRARIIIEKVQSEEELEGEGEELELAVEGGQDI
jgi:hypothetical protein